MEDRPELVSADRPAAAGVVLEQERALAVRVVEAAVTDEVEDVIAVGAKLPGEREEIRLLEPVDRHGVGVA